MIDDGTDLGQLIEGSKGGLLPFRVEDPGLLRAQGADWLDFLDRISTNALRDLDPGQARQTLLTNALGRLIDRLWVINQGDIGWLLTTLPKRDQDLNWLRQYIFFRDDVTIEPMEGDWQLWALLGPGATDFLLKTYRVMPGNLIAETQLEDGLVYWESELAEQGYWLLLSGSDADPPSDLADKAGPEARAAYDYQRIQSGQIRIDNRYLPECTPLELGMKPLIDFEKGCYIGQEVIARMESRGKIPRQLFRIRSDIEHPPGSPVVAGGRELGTVLEVAAHPGGGYVGLALVRTNLPQKESLEYRVEDSSITLEPVI
jgi:folate-binding protein YgfZ